MADKAEKTINLELSKEEANQMLQTKIAELNAVQNELNSVKARAMKVYEENNLLQHSPQYAEQAAEMKFHIEMAKKFTAARAFPKLNPEQIYTLIKAGSEMGMKPIEALNSLYIISGKIEPYGKGMIAILTKAGYKLRYEETKDQCTVFCTHEDGFEGSELAHVNDPILKKSNAIKISSRNKLRFHAVRTLLNFQLPHLITSTADLFERVHLEANEDENGNTKLLTGSGEILEKLERVQTVEVLKVIEEEHGKEIAKNISLASALGAAKKRLNYV